jgi:hypothetical protein
VRKLTPSRGEIKIVDASTGESVAVATNIEKKLVYAVPKKILNKKETAEKLAAVLNMSEDGVVAKVQHRLDATATQRRDGVVEGDAVVVQAHLQPRDLLGRIHGTQGEGVRALCLQVRIATHICSIKLK